MHVSSLVVGAFQENSWLLMDSATRDAVLIDPGGEGERILAQVAEVGAQVRAIWLTHAHIDHVGAIAEVRRHMQVPIHLHPLDQPIYARGAEVSAMYGLPFDVPPSTDEDLAEGDVLRVGSLSFDVLHVPGHAPGHVAFFGHGVVFGGDCLFAGSVGRTDLPLCDPADLRRSLERFAALPPETVVYSGHGEATTIGAELETNPFLNGIARVPLR